MWHKEGGKGKERKGRGAGKEREIKTKCKKGKRRKIQEGNRKKDGRERGGKER